MTYNTSTCLSWAKKLPNNFLVEQFNLYSVLTFCQKFILLNCTASETVNIDILNNITIVNSQYKKSQLEYFPVGFLFLGARSLRENIEENRIFILIS